MDYYDLKKYVKFEKGELYDLLFVTLILSILFSLTILNYFKTSYKSFTKLAIELFLFIFIMLFLRIKLIKFYGYFKGFRLTFENYRINRFGLSPRMSFSYWAEFPVLHSKEIKANKKKNRASYKIDFKGLHSIFVTFLLYILSLGYFIFPITWYFKRDFIPHRHYGTKDFLERKRYEVPSRYRFSKVIFLGNIYYLFIAFIIKYICSYNGSSLDNVFMAILIWFAFWNLMPIPFTEGFDYYVANSKLWFINLILLIFTFASLFLYSNIFLIIVTDIVVFLIILVYYLKKEVS